MRRVRDRGRRVVALARQALVKRTPAPGPSESGRFGARIRPAERVLTYLRTRTGSGPTAKRLSLTSSDVFETWTTASTRGRSWFRPAIDPRLVTCITQTSAHDRHAARRAYHSSTSPSIDRESTTASGGGGDSESASSTSGSAWTPSATYRLDVSRPARSAIIRRTAASWLGSHGMKSAPGTDAAS